MQRFRAGRIRANDFTSILGPERVQFEHRAGFAYRVLCQREWTNFQISRRDEKTVIGNLREVAERLAPGRACISVVSDHGFAKTVVSLNLFLRGGDAIVIG